MVESFRRPRISLGFWLSTWQTLLRGSCEAFWATPLRSYLTMTLQLLLTTEVLDLAAVSGISQQCTTHPTEPLFRKGSWLHGVGQGHMYSKENKEQKGKRKYHAGTPHPNDRGGFTQWF